MVDFEAVGQVTYSGPALVCMGNDDHFVSAVNELLYLLD